MNGILKRYLSADGAVVCSVLDGTAMCAEMERIHKTSAVVTAALGRLSMAASLIGYGLKDDGDTVTLRLDGGGPAGILVAVADWHGNVKSYAEQPIVELPLNAKGKLDVAGAVGTDGTLFVIKDLGMKEPYAGQTALVSGEIAEDVTQYFAVSEQVPTACGLGVLVNPDLTVKFAGGYLIQLLPGASEDTIAKVEGGIYAAPSVTSILRDDPDPAHMLQTVMSDFDLEILETTPIEYRCYCSRERTERALLSLGSAELEDILREQGGAKLTCQFCDRVHVFSGDELRAMIAELKARGK